MPIINGTAGPDVLTGTDEDDVIDGRNGADRIDARGGNDLIRGIGGSLDIMGGAGDDTVFYTGGGFTRVDGGDGTDTFDLSASFSGSGTSTIRGVSGSSNTLTYGGDIVGFERIIGLANASMRYDLASITTVTYLRAGSLADVIQVGGAAEVRAGGGNDEIFVYAPGSQVYGEDGNDRFQLGQPGQYTAATLIDGGAGNDQIVLTVSGAVSFTLGDGQFQGLTYRSIENLDIRIQNTATVTGTDTANVIRAAGAGEVYAGGGDDTVTVGNGVVGHGGDGADRMLGAYYFNETSLSGIDRLYGDAGDDTLSGSGVLSGGDGNDRLEMLNFTDGGTYDGGQGVDTLTLVRNPNFASYTSSFNVSLVTGVMTRTSAGGGQSTLVGIERVILGDGADTITLAGGHEYAEGGAGSDTIRGGAGNDVIYGDQSVVVDYSGADGVDFLYGEDGDDMIFGGGGGDLLSGGAGDDVLDGGDGSDNIDGGTGFDIAAFTYARSEAVITYEDGRILIQRNSGPIDTLTGVESLRFTDGYYDVVNGQVSGQPRGLIDGTAVADRLNGTAGADTLRGAAGDDVLRGNGGSDFIDGGAGTDTSRYNGVLGSYSTASASRVSGGVEGGTDELTGIEALQFLDGRLSFDVNAATTVVYRLYDAAFDRAPDVFGLADYARAIQEGRATVQSILNVFAASAEFQARYGALTNEQFVAEIYRFSLNRDPDGGARVYIDALNNGSATRAQILGILSESNEHVTAINAAIVARGLFVQDEQTASVARLYDSVFNRLPDLGGLKAYRDALDSGYSLKDVAAVLVASPEFQTRFGALTNQQFVEQIYRFVLDREGDAAGVQSYVSALDNGASRTDVVLVLSESQEHRYSYQATYDSQIRQLGVNGYDPSGGAPMLDAAKSHDAFVLPALQDGGLDGHALSLPGEDTASPLDHDTRVGLGHGAAVVDAPPDFWPEDIRAVELTAGHLHSEWI